MRKRNHKILKSDATVDLYFNSYKKVEATFPAIVERLAGMIDADQIDQQELDHFQASVKKTLETYAFTAKSSRLYQKNHKEDDKNPAVLTEASLEKLGYIQKTALEKLDTICFILEQLAVRSEFESIARPAQEKDADEESE